MLVVTGLALGGAAFAVTPSVTDVPRLVADRLAAHDATGDGGHIPARVAAALLATEDSRYYHDPALDPLGTLRAAWGTVTGNPNLGGATIEVQLAKMLFLPDSSGVVAEVEEAALAFKLDAAFSKRQILALYLDAAYFGNGAWGITEAAERYFGVAPDALSWAQASLLAGLVQAPSAYDPVLHLRRALARRRHVLARMVATGVVDRAEAAAIAREPLDPVVRFGNS